jgi:hypothetical protein
MNQGITTIRRERKDLRRFANGGTEEQVLPPLPRR